MIFSDSRVKDRLDSKKGSKADVPFGVHLPLFLCYTEGVMEVPEKF